MFILLEKAGTENDADPFNKLLKVLDMRSIYTEKTKWNIEGNLGHSKNKKVGRAVVETSWRSMLGNGGTEKTEHKLKQLALKIILEKNGKYMVESQ